MRLIPIPPSSALPPSDGPIHETDLIPQVVATDRLQTSLVVQLGARKVRMVQGAVIEFQGIPYVCLSESPKPRLLFAHDRSKTDTLLPFLTEFSSCFAKDLIFHTQVWIDSKAGYFLAANKYFLTKWTLGVILLALAWQFHRAYPQVANPKEAEVFLSREESLYLELARAIHFTESENVNETPTRGRE